MHSIYTPGASILHQLHPLTKLVAAALLLTATYLLEWPPLPLLIFGLLLALARFVGVAGPLFGAVGRLVVPIALSLFLIQGLLFPPAGATPLPLGPITLTREGPLFAFVVSARLLVLTTALLLVLQTTHPADLVFALTERGLPRSIGYVLLVSLQIVPAMVARATAILEAQRSRGLETQGGVRRARAIVPLVGPLVVGALLDVEERAMAIESRAYTARGPKTNLRQLVDPPAQRVARWIMVLVIVGLIAGRAVRVAGW